MNKQIQNTPDSPIQKVLVVDDEENLRIILNRALTKAGFVVEEADSGHQALELLQTGPFDLVISDIEMPLMDGVELLTNIKTRYPDLDVIIITGYASKYTYVDIMNAGASDYMSKPFDTNSILARIKRIAREKKNLIELKRSNQELCMAIDRANRLAMDAKEASKAKTYFLASMSHEIRTPLNGIVGYTDMLMDTSLSDEQRQYLNNAKLSCETLLSVVNDILDFSKVEAGKLSLDVIEFDPEVLCHDTMEVVRTKVDETKVELLIAVADTVPGQVKGDPHRFRQVLLNLLSNAVKFTEKGCIKLTLDAQIIDKDQSRLIVAVQDSGIGVPENRLKSIFEPFIQSEDDITNRFGGTGLGLAISRNIAMRMEGDVWAENNPDKGACFYFTACMETLPNKPVKRVRPAELKNKRVLLSSISQETGKILTHEFELAGMEVVQVEFETLDQLKNNKDLSNIDIGIIDFGKIVKSRNYPGEPVNEKYLEIIDPKQFDFNFIACSIPVPGIVKTFSKMGYKGYLPKPIFRAKLFAMIAYVLGTEGVNELFKFEEDQLVTSHLLAERRKKGASILLVEDNPVNQKMTQLMLSKAGYTIEIAENGKEAVDLYSKNPKGYDLIFMDINMPVMNGFDATKQIRKFEREQAKSLKIPILALTANVLDDFQVKCMQAGMDAFLTKPIKRDIVFKAIQDWIG